MKSLIIVSFLAAVAIVAYAENEGTSFDYVHSVQKRQIIKPVTIMVKPPQPQCVFYECIRSCKQRGYKSGGYCTINGCQCLR